MPGYANQLSTDIGGIPNTAAVRNVGESEHLIYTAPSKSAVTGAIVTNKTGGILPVSIYTKKTVTASVSLKSLTNNVATLTTSAAHNLYVGDIITVANVDATFNGTYTITAVPSNVSFTYAKTNANVASTAVSPVGSATNSTAIFYIRKDVRVPNGESIELINNPFVMSNTDRIYAISSVENAFDVILSVQEGVN